ncbi:hypothetical protein EWM64_g8623 [Hericium alpestre]|uniref:Uncharacterized protein n=1 Tax=Hericium alpestre TaxID=135208 RepID=A0A4Y9ZMA9_9AGAM|nr:hypothetical protein EWM64_g8623 [Hericium alpestre]
MATTAAAMPVSAFRSRPAISSPLANPSPQSKPSFQPLPKRAGSFPASQRLRPFPSIAQTLSPASPAGRDVKAKKGPKLIEPPKGYAGGTFVLNLTQAELSRQD